MKTPKIHVPFESFQVVWDAEPYEATFVDDSGGSHPNVKPFRVGSAWIFQIYQTGIYKLTSTDSAGKQLKTRHSKTALTASNAASQWEAANPGGLYSVRDVRFRPGNFC